MTTTNNSVDLQTNKNIIKELKDIKKIISEIQLLQKQFNISLQQISNKLKYKD